MIGNKKIAAVGDIIKDNFSKIFSKQKPQKFKDILKDANISSALQKLHKDYSITADLSVDVKKNPSHLLYHHTKLT